MIFTISNYLTPFVYGLEHTQICRQNYFRHKKIPAQTLIMKPLQFAHPYSVLADNGFEPDAILSIPDSYSDISRLTPSLTLEDWVQTYHSDLTSSEVDSAPDQRSAQLLTDRHVLTITLYESRYVSQVLTHDRKTGKALAVELFSSARYFYKDLQTERFVYYNKDGQQALTGKQIAKDDFVYDRGGQLLTSEDLLVDYLNQHLSDGDVLIIDDINLDGQKLPQLKKGRSLTFVRYLHYNILHPRYQAAFTETIVPKNKWVDYFVATAPDLVSFANQSSHIPTLYCPPGYVSLSTSDTYPLKKSKKFLTVSNFHPIKRLDLLMKIFSQLSEFTLDIYGADRIPEQIARSVPSNVVFKGFCETEKLPWADYNAYISMSESEAFAFSIVEALGHGLPVYGRSVACANKNHIQDGVTGYRTTTDLALSKSSNPLLHEQALVRDMVTLIRDSYLRSQRLHHSAKNFARQYDFEHFVKAMDQLGKEIGW